MVMMSYLRLVLIVEKTIRKHKTRVTCKCLSARISVRRGRCEGEREERCGRGRSERINNYVRGTGERTERGVEWGNDRENSLPILQLAPHSLKIHWFLDNLEILGELTASDGFQEWPAILVPLHLRQDHMTYLHVFP